VAEVAEAIDVVAVAAEAVDASHTHAVHEQPSGCEQIRFGPWPLFSTTKALFYAQKISAVGRRSERCLRTGELSGCSRIMVCLSFIGL
jgi:hypothetical protein